MGRSGSLVEAQDLKHMNNLPAHRIVVTADLSTSEFSL